MANAKVAAAEVEFLKKITTSEIGLPKSVIEKLTEANPDDNLEIARIVGIATSSEIKTTKYGDSIKFMGQFEAQNVVTGQKYRAKILYVPSIAQDMIDTMMQAVPAGEECNVQFAIAITAKFRDTEEGTRFAFHANSLLKTTRAPDLLDEIAGNLPEPKLIEQKPAKKK